MVSITSVQGFSEGRQVALSGRNLKSKDGFFLLYFFLNDDLIYRRGFGGQSWLNREDFFLGGGDIWEVENRCVNASRATARRSGRNRRCLYLSFLSNSGGACQEGVLFILLRELK